MKRTIVILLSALLWACSDKPAETPEERIRATLKSLETAAEARSVSDFMQHVSEDYVDHRGNKKKEIEGILRLQYLRNQNIHILSTIQSLDIQGDVATVEISTAMAATEAGLEENSSRLKANTHRFSVVLRSSDAQQTWLIDSVSWQRGWSDY